MSENNSPYGAGAAIGPAGEPAPGRADLVAAIAEGAARLASRHRCAVAQQVHHSGISLGHLQILWILQEHGPLPVSRLATWLGIGVPNATGLLDRMEQRGLVERSRDAADRRVVLARPTDLGRATVAELDGWRLGLVEQLTAPLADDQLGAILGAIRAALLAPHDDRPDDADAAHARGEAARAAGGLPGAAGGTAGAVAEKGASVIAGAVGP
jgi:DNA-binding MarR family transcriptional regulator